MIKSKKILFVMNDYSLMGGIERVTNNLLRSFIKYNLPVWGIWSLYQKNNIVFMDYPQEIQFFVNSNISELVTFAESNNIGYIIVQNGDISIGNRIAKMFFNSNIKVISIIHTSFYHWIKKMYIKSFYDCLRYLKMFLWTQHKSRVVMKSLIAHSHLVLFVSRTAQQEVEFVLGDKYPKLDYIYNISFGDSMSIMNDHIIKKEKIVVYAGRLEGEKQVLKTVKVLAPLFKKHTEWKYFIIGDGSEKEAIKKFLVENTIDNIFLIGQVNNVGDYLLKSKICLLYSLYEGLPTILLEAAERNNALVAYKGYGGTADIVIEGKNGYLVSEDYTLYTRIEFLMNNEVVLYNMMYSDISYEQFYEHSIMKKWHQILE